MSTYLELGPPFGGPRPPLARNHKPKDWTPPGEISDFQVHFVPRLLSLRLVKMPCVSGADSVDTPDCTERTEFCQACAVESAGFDFTLPREMHRGSCLSATDAVGEVFLLRLHGRPTSA